MTELTISVIIPVYNGEKYISRAIESVLGQTYPAHEIIVVNDGSGDGTAEVLAGYQDRIRTISIPNRGVSHARNVGITASTGEPVAFLDADDIWVKDKLEAQAAVFRAHPEVGLCCCDYLYYNVYVGKEVNQFSSFRTRDDLYFDRPMKRGAFKVLLKENVIVTSSVVVRKAVVEKAGGFDEKLRLAEDYDLWLRCSWQTEFVFLSAFLINKITHDANLTNNELEVCKHHERVLIAVRSKHADLVSNHRLWGVYREALAGKRYQIGNAYFRYGNARKAFGYYWNALNTSWTIANVLCFLNVVARKTVRMLSVGLISGDMFRGHSGRN